MFVARAGAGVLAGLLVAAISYPIGAYGADWMFSSSVSPRDSVPNSVAPPVQQPPFDNPRRRAPPMPLAQADVPESGDKVLR